MLSIAKKLSTALFFQGRIAGYSCGHLGTDMNLSFMILWPIMQTIHLNHLSSAFGQEKNVSLNNLSADEVTRALENVMSGKA